MTTYLDMEWSARICLDDYIHHVTSQLPQNIQENMSRMNELDSEYNGYMMNLDTKIEDLYQESESSDVEHVQVQGLQLVKTVKRSRKIKAKQWDIKDDGVQNKIIAEEPIVKKLNVEFENEWKKFNETTLLPWKYVRSRKEEQFDVSLVSPEQFDVSSVSPEQFDVSSVSREQFDVSSVTSEEIDVTSVSPEHYDMSSVTYEQFDVSSVTSEQFEVSSVTSEQFDVSSVLPEQVDVSSVIPEQTTAPSTDVSNEQEPDENTQDFQPPKPKRNLIKRFLKDSNCTDTTDYSTCYDVIAKNFANDSVVAGEGAAATTKKAAKKVYTGQKRGRKRKIINSDCITDDTKYCICEQVSYGPMICCDNEQCPIQWFHYPCMMVKRKPRGEWFCPNCRRNGKSKVMKPRAVLMKELDEYNLWKETRALN